jgi:mannose-6-phosphate isomerase-like protein (cupin superfamily)
MTNEWIRRRAEGKVIVKGKNKSFQQSRQALLKYMIHRKDWDELSVTGWSVFINHIKQHSGRHTHQGGTLIFVLEGRGYTIVDGERFDWKKGDLILLPIKPGGCEHQHFNENPEVPAEWIAFSFRPQKDAIASWMEQKEEHPDWVSSEKK